MEMLLCEICEAYFKSEMALTGHQLSVHGSKCEICEL